MSGLVVRHARDIDRPIVQDMVAAFQSHLAEIDPHGQIRAFRSTDDLKRYVRQIWTDVEEREGRCS